MSDGGADDRLERAAQARHAAQGLHARWVAATKHADQTTARVQEARDALSEEERDVERLEGLSWSRILTALRGNRSTELEREQAERDAARYALAEGQARDDLAWRDVEALRSQLDALGDVEGEYVAALADREAWSVGHDPETSRVLAEIVERRGVLLAEDTEGREAFEAGADARTHLVQARGLLRSAGSWSTWDTFGGGGLFTDMVKYDKLDQVAVALRRADAALGRFSRELADLRLSGVEAVNLDGMTQAFDVWFDNIFTDWSVKNRIGDAAQRTAAAADVVHRVRTGLAEQERALATRRADLVSRRERLLTAP